MFKNRKTLIIVAVAAAIVIAGSVYGGLTYAARRRAAFARDFTQTIFGTAALAYSTDSHALTTDQVDRILSLLRPLELQDVISDQRAHEILADIKGILTPDQVTALKGQNARDLPQQMRGGAGGQQPGGPGGPGGPGARTGRQFRNQARSVQFTGRMFTSVIDALENKLNGGTRPNSGSGNTGGATP